MNRFLTWFERGIGTVTVILFIMMTIVVFAQVVLRYVFDTSIVWGEEFSRYAMIWLAFLGAALGIRHGEHTRIDFFIKLIPFKYRKIVEIVNKLLCIVFLSVITYYSIIMFENTFKLLTPSMQIPVGLVHMILPITGVFMIINLLIQIKTIATLKTEGDRPI
ncbi:hypothetical protein A6P54_13265 [Bacillus sp. MKU004]|jgi:TRAP-type C4-dicarboxylate transport system permease small subunit|nr:hypothetical protein A6P54_13265 [Bacillus sp. MKU004]